jgi:hypothetical protein
MALRIVFKLQENGSSLPQLLLLKIASHCVSPVAIVATGQPSLLLQPSCASTLTESVIFTTTRLFSSLQADDLDR